MPIYEYKCARCDTVFEKLRPRSERDAALKCPDCGCARTRPMMSMFAGRTGETGSVAGSGGCSGCSRSSCAGCHH